MITQRHTRHNPLVLLYITLKAALHSEKRYLSVTSYFPVNPVSSPIAGSWTVCLNLDPLLFAESQLWVFAGLFSILHISWDGPYKRLQHPWEPEFSEDSLHQYIYCWKGATIELTICNSPYGLITVPCFAVASPLAVVGNHHS